MPDASFDPPNWPTNEEILDAITRGVDPMLMLTADAIYDAVRNGVNDSFPPGHYLGLAVRDGTKDAMEQTDA